MDRVTNILSMANTEVLKEPRGFIKFIQIVVAICAFACAVSNTTQTAFKYECAANNKTSYKKILPFYYPFDLEYSTQFDLPLCGEGEKSKGSCYGNFSSSAQFFVFIGVTAFLLCLAVLTFYILADDKYQQNELIPTVDFSITLVYTILWFISSCAWADQVGKIKHYTDPSNLFLENPANKAILPECLYGTAHCYVDLSEEASYANLNFSIIFGFLCVFVWAGNVWFLYKETKWYKAKHPASAQDDGGIENYPGGR